MKNLFILFFLFIFSASFAQTDKLAKEVLSDIIEHRIIKEGEARVINKLLDVYLDDFIKKLKEDNGVIYDTKANFNKDSIHLSLKEREYLITAFRKQKDSILWKKDDFSPYKIIEQKDVRAFSNRYNQHHILDISYPLFIRNNQIALVFFEITTKPYAVCHLAFYRKIKGVWRSWICVKEVIED
ncbi:MAG: hypothetical protein V4548_09405 [Bacteroidota bacterium]